MHTAPSHFSPVYYQMAEDGTLCNITDGWDAFDTNTPPVNTALCVVPT